jgi:DegV family protein with EDD domain
MENVQRGANMVKIFTDTDANLPAEVIEELGIAVVPIQVHIDGRTYLEDVEISPQEFLELLPLARELPTTSQPSPGQFHQAYAPWVDRGEPIVSIHVSGALSGTIRSAQTAAEMFPDAEIHLVDSRSVSGGQGLMVVRAARMAAAGADAETIVAALQPMIERMRLFFLLDTLEYLHKGGRIGGAARFIGTLLNMKPILTVDDGAIDALERQRTRRKALSRLEELALQHADDGQNAYLAIVQIGAEDEAQALKARLHDRLDPVDFLMCGIGPGLSVHSGPGAIGVAIYTE